MLEESYKWAEKIKEKFLGRKELWIFVNRHWLLRHPLYIFKELYFDAWSKQDGHVATLLDNGIIMWDTNIKNFIFLFNFLIKDRLALGDYFNIY